MTEDKRRNPVLASLLLLLVVALWSLPFLRVAPNRLVSGQAVYFSSIVPGALWLLLAMLCVVVLTTIVYPRRAWLWLAIAVSAALMPCLLWLAANHANLTAQGAASISRTSFGSSFWLSVVLLGFMASTALQQLRATAMQRAAVGAAVLLALAALLASGWCGDLSLIMEYNNRADDFGQVLARHMQIVLLSLVLTVCIGLPLGWFAHTRAKAGRALLPVLNIIQTIPSIALFGLLMAPLALLAANLPALGQAGISGVGFAPSVIALTLYGLLPVVRSVLAGLQQVSAPMRSAATALGLTAWQVLVYIELPLALPILLGGLRTAAVACVGLAAVTALIGAGGLGSILFEGLFSNAQDLVLLGVLPIIALGVMTDALFSLLIGLARKRVQPC
ncbi:MAG: ABC transporter permease [Polaromonas sp.]